MFVRKQWSPLGIGQKVNNGDFPEKAKSLDREYYNNPCRYSYGNKSTGQKTILNENLLPFPDVYPISSES